MDWEVIERFMEKWKCSYDTACYYFELREGHLTPEAALVWCKLIAPPV